MSDPSIGQETSDNLERLQGKYLTFSLDNQEYGIEILKVKEIIGIMDITTLPSTPSFVKGVINLRGRVIPVVDLRLKFGLPEATYTEHTCIIVVQTTDNGAASQIGLIVDAVSEVLQVGRDDLEPTPSFGDAIDTTFILAMVKSDDRVRTLLNIDHVLAASEMTGFSL